MGFSVAIASKDAIARLPLDRASAALLERTEWLEQVLREAGPELDARAVRSVPVELEDGADLAGLVRRVSDELEALTDRVAELRRRDEALARARAEAGRLLPTEGAATPADAPKTLSDVFRRAGLLDAAREGRGGAGIIEGVDPAAIVLGKATLTSATLPPDVTRTDLVAFAPIARPRVLDIVPEYLTTQAAVAYLAEAISGEAAERAEAAAYVEVGLSYTEQTVPVRSIGASLPVTDEVRQDVAQAAEWVDRRLRDLVIARLDKQVVVGDGAASNLLGTINVPGIQTQARGTDTGMDALLKAMVKVRTTGQAEPSAVLIHPNDAQAIRLAKTVDGIYLFGPPYDAGIPRLWGVPMVETSVLTAGTAVVGDYTAHAGLFRRAEIEVQVGYSGTDFAAGRVTYRAGVRVAMVHFRPAAFCTVTGL